MFHLFVIAGDSAWEQDAVELPRSRCLREFTEAHLITKFGLFTGDALEELLELPCVFAYEGPERTDIRVGTLLEIQVLPNAVRIRFAVEKTFTIDDAVEFWRQLGIGKPELWRTHWALKDRDIEHTLRQTGVEWSFGALDIFSHQFDVAFSFPGDVRPYIEKLAIETKRRLGRNRVFYDNFFQGHLARPDLDLALQRLYREQAKLVVVSLSGEYANRRWCRIEFKAIREIVNGLSPDRIMFLRHDDGEVAGVFPSDGYVDTRKVSPEIVAKWIQARVSTLGSLGTAPGSTSSAAPAPLKLQVSLYEDNVLHWHKPLQARIVRLRVEAENLRATNVRVRVDEVSIRVDQRWERVDAFVPSLLTITHRPKETVIPEIAKGDRELFDFFFYRAFATGHGFDVWATEEESHPLQFEIEPASASHRKLPAGKYLVKCSALCSEFEPTRLAFELDYSADQDKPHSSAAFSIQEIV